MSAIDVTVATRNEDVITPKICSMFILAATSIAAGALPLKLGALFYKTATSKSIIAFEQTMSFFLHFGGGVLLCTIFLHLIPELREHMQPIRDQKLLPDIHLSYTDLVVCFGFFLVYSIEQVVHSRLGGHESHHRSHNDDTIELHSQCNSNGIANGTSNGSLGSCKLIEKSVKYKIVHCEVQTNGCSEHKHIKDGVNESKNYQSFENHHHCVAVEPMACDEPQLLQHHHDHDHIPDFSDSIGSAVLMVMALSLHEVFEGMTVGLESEANMVWYLLAAISCHKIMLSAFIGLQLLATKTKLAVSYIFIAIYAFTSPVGILAGLLVSLCSSQSVYLQLTSVLLQGIATGTLIYVVFFEVYFKNDTKYKLSGSLKAVSSIIGFVFMAILQIWLSHEH